MIVGYLSCAVFIASSEVIVFDIDFSWNFCSNKLGSICKNGCFPEGFLVSGDSHLIRATTSGVRRIDCCTNPTHPLS